MAMVKTFAVGAVILAALLGMAPRPARRPKRPDTVAHCLVGGLAPGMAGRFEPCQDTQRYGRI